MKLFRPVNLKKLLAKKSVTTVSKIVLYKLLKGVTPLYNNSPIGENT